MTGQNSSLAAMKKANGKRDPREEYLERITN